SCRLVNGAKAIPPQCLGWEISFVKLLSAASLDLRLRCFDFTESHGTGRRSLRLPPAGDTALNLEIAAPVSLHGLVKGKRRKRECPCDHREHRSHLFHLVSPFIELLCLPFPSSAS